MASEAEIQFIAQIKERLTTGTFQDGIKSFNFCRAKFKVPSHNDYTYNMFLRITECGGDLLNINLEFPKSAQSIRSNHPFFHKLRERILALCGDETLEEDVVKPPMIRTSSPNPFDE